MIVFVSIAALATLGVIGWLLRPLLGARIDDSVSPQQVNASVYRDQLETLEREHARKELSAAEYEAARDELQLRLLDDEAEPGQPSQAPRPLFWTASRTAWAIALALPLASAAMYGWLGAPLAIDPLRAEAAEETQILKMVDGLAARLKVNPDNPKGWAMLARSYKAMGRLPEAVQAYAKVGSLMETDPDMLAHYADLLAAHAGDSLQGKPTELIDKALALNPHHPMALMLSGSAAYQRGDYAAAVVQWEKLLPVLEPESGDAAWLSASLTNARAKSGRAAPAAAKK